MRVASALNGTEGKKHVKKMEITFNKSAGKIQSVSRGIRARKQVGEMKAVRAKFQRGAVVVDNEGRAGHVTSGPIHNEIQVTWVDNGEESDWLRMDDFELYTSP